MSEHLRKSTFASRRTPDSRDGEHSGKALRWNKTFRFGALAGTILLVAFLFPRTSLVEYQYEVGSIWSGDIIQAPFAFPLYKDEETYGRDVAQARDSVPPVYSPTGVTVQAMRDTIRATAQTIAQSTARPSYLSETSWTFVQSIQEEDRPLRLQGIARALYDGLDAPYRAGVINRNKSLLQKERIAIRHSEVYEEVVPLNHLYDSLGVVHTVETSLTRRLSPQARDFAMELFNHLYQPMYAFNPVLTEEAMRNAVASVPKSQGIVAEGETIVSTGDRITEATKLKLTSYQRSRQLREEEENTWLQLAGNVGHVIVLFSLFLLYLINFRPRILHDNLQLGIILLGVLIVTFTAYVSLEVALPLPIEYLILVPFLSMLVVVLFDSRTAFYLTVITCLLIAGIRGNDYAIAVASLSAGMLAVYTVRDIRSRTQLLRSIAFSMLGFAVAITALALERGESLEEIGLKLGFAAINSTLSPVLTFGAIMLIESLFDVATDLKLVEFDDLNHPLLRALADKAPGTYQHTLTIARLAESAASAIGANALLAKVGAYFHDVGKVAKAEYFVENQMQMGNKHDKLKPERSAKLIRQHVQDGIELARQYKLPQRIIDFIPTHHGTTVIKYFLDKAKEENPEVNESDFRYPGPKPHSRETGILMLADAVEATSRSLPNPTPKAIEETIDRMIKKRLDEGQLDHCDLTLADLTKIKHAFLRNLIGMSHPRIQYKKDKEDEQETPEEAESKAQKQEPVIPYIDDAFGNLEAELSYGKPVRKEDEKKGKEKQEKEDKKKKER